MRLIDADALIERLDDFNKWCKDERLQGSLFAVDVVGDMPTVDVLDKIRAEIIKHFEGCYLEEDMTDERKAEHKAYENVLQIIDKYTK